MNKIKLTSSLMVLLVMSGACKKSETSDISTSVETKNEQEVVAKEVEQTYNVNLSDSQVDWWGYKLVKSETSSHMGFLKFKSGDLQTNGDKLVSGKFVIDVTSLKSTDIEDNEERSKLDGHLKSPDFFDVDKYPTSSFEITNVEAVNTGDYNFKVSGNLEILGQRHNISFNAKVNTSSDNELELESEKFTINRKDWGVVYKSTFADVLIKDEIDLIVKVKAKK